MTDRMTDLRKSLAATSQALAESETIIAQLRDELAEAKKAPAPVVVTDDKDSVIADMGREISGLRKKLERLADRDGLATELGTKLAKAEADIADIRKARDIAERGKNEALQAVDRVREDMAKAVAQHTGVIDAKSAEIAALQAQLKSADAAAQEAKAQFRQELRQAKKDHDATKGHEAKLTKLEDDLRQEAAKALGQSRVDMQAQIDRAKAMARFEHDSKSEVMAELHEAQANNAKMSAEIERMSQAIEKQAYQIEQLRGQLHEAWRNMRSAEKTTEAIRAQLRETTQKR